MRYRKRIKIAKGINVNLSGSGASLSMGVRGASVTVGKKGTYLNTGIPGTGIYDRRKIAGGRSKATTSNLNDNSSATSMQVKVELKLDEKGKPILNLFDSQGRAITDESTIRKVKRTDQYKQGVEKLMQDKKEEIENSFKEFVEIYKSTPALFIESDIKEELKNLTPQHYERKLFNEPAPLIEDVKKDLEIIAKQKINKIFFWKNKSLRNDYVANNLQSKFQELTEAWEQRKNNFELEQDNIEIEENERYNKEYEFVLAEIENYLEGNEDYVGSKIEILLNEITLPVEFSIDYDYDREKSVLYIDLDLPEIEDMPVEKVNTLASGKISVKNKSQKEIKYDYAQCVCGIAFYFSGLFFNISSMIKTIQISGYTQRVNKTTGNIGDDYVYSIRFDRSVFENLNYKEIDPIEAFNNFDYRMNFTKSFDLKTIEPFNM